MSTVSNNLPIKSQNILNAVKQQHVQNSPKVDAVSKQPQQDEVVIKGNNPHKAEKKDPFMQYPTRLLAYTNEVGEALSLVIHPALRAAFWMPALGYIGADIADKTKKGEDGTGQKSSAGMGIKQGAFQGLASVILPTVAVHKGQHFFGDMYAKMNKNNEDFQALYKNKEETLEKFVAENTNNVNEVKGNAVKKFFVKQYQGIAGLFGKTFNDIDKNKKELLKQLGDDKNLVQTAKDLEKYDNNLVENMGIKDINNLTDTNKKDLKKGLEKFVKQIFNHDLVAEHAALKEVSKNEAAGFIAKHAKELAVSSKGLGNAIKTIGGFATLFALMKPIDTFVEKVIIHKVVHPVLINAGMLNKDELH